MQSSLSLYPSPCALFYFFFFFFFFNNSRNTLFVEREGGKKRRRLIGRLFCFLFYLAVLPFVFSAQTQTFISKIFPSFLFFLLFSQLSGKRFFFFRLAIPRQFTTDEQKPRKQVARSVDAHDLKLGKLMISMYTNRPRFFLGQSTTKSITCGFFFFIIINNYFLTKIFFISFLEVCFFVCSEFSSASHQP